MEGINLEKLILDSYSFLIKKFKNPKRFYKDILFLFQKNFNIDSGSIFLLKRNFLHLIYGIGRTKKYIGIKVKLGERVSGIAAIKNKILYLEDGLENYEEFRNLPGIKEVKRAFVIPIRYDNKVIGILTLNKEEEEEEE
ncbi:MAG: hypothetical protein ACPLZ9_06825, partial [Candidatus Ratteibacteria bacterium]